MSKRLNKKAWCVISQARDHAFMAFYLNENKTPLAIFETESEARTYKSNVLKDIKEKKYRVVACIISYVEPTFKKHGL